MSNGMLELAKADVAEPDPGDETVVAGGHHRGQLVIEAGADAPVTGQPTWREPRANAELMAAREDGLSRLGPAVSGAG